MRTASPDHQPGTKDPKARIATVIDGVLILAVFLIVISSATILPLSKDVALPSAKDVRAQGQTVLNVTWVATNKAGSVEIDKQRFADPAQTLSLLQARVLANRDLRVLIRADRSVPYEYLKRVLIAVGQAGIGTPTFFVVEDPSAAPGKPAKEYELDVKLPDGSTPKAGSTAKTPIIVDISAEDQVLANNESYAAADKSLTRFRAWLKSISGFGSDDPIWIRPVASTRYERLMDVLDACHAAGYQDLSFAP